MEEKRIVKPWQAGLMLLVGIAVIIVGLLVMKLNNRIVLALDGVIMCLMAWCFGIPYAELQQGIKETASSMIVAILILLAVGVLVGTWMASGTVPSVARPQLNSVDRNGMPRLLNAALAPIACNWWPARRAVRRCAPTTWTLRWTVFRSVPGWPAANCCGWAVHEADLWIPLESRHPSDTTTPEHIGPARTQTDSPSRARRWRSRTCAAG